MVAAAARLLGMGANRLSSSNSNMARDTPIVDHNQLAAEQGQKNGLRMLAFAGGAAYALQLQQMGMQLWTQQEQNESQLVTQATSGK